MTNYVILAISREQNREKRQTHVMTGLTTGSPINKKQARALCSVIEPRVKFKVQERSAERKSKETVKESWIHNVLMGP